MNSLIFSLQVLPPMMIFSDGILFFICSSISCSTKQNRNASQNRNDCDTGIKYLHMLPGDSPGDISSNNITHRSGLSNTYDIFFGINRQSINVKPSWHAPSSIQGNCDRITIIEKSKHTPISQSHVGKKTRKDSQTSFHSNSSIEYLRMRKYKTNMR